MNINKELKQNKNSTTSGAILQLQKKKINSQNNLV